MMVSYCTQMPTRLALSGALTHTNNTNTTTIRAPKTFKTSQNRP